MDVTKSHTCKIPYYSVTRNVGALGLAAASLFGVFMTPTPGWIIVLLMAIPMACILYWIIYQIKTGCYQRFAFHVFLLVLISVVACLFYRTFV